MHPKVFVSHASEDKERFVLKFATELREHGIDAWIDKWEMQPGDSLVDKIFEEGIKQASAVIVILSKNSERKPWVVEELNAGYIKKINEKSKLIPVIIEDCEVPECLRSIVWVKIKNLNDYKTELDSIVASVYDVNEKPELGAAPAYTTLIHGDSPISSHSKIDNSIIKISCEEAIKSKSYSIDADNIFFKAGEPIFPENELIESIRYLGEYGFFDLTYLIGKKIPECTITPSGFELYARSNIENYGEKFQSVIFSIINKELRSGEEISRDTGQPEFLVNHILDTLASGGLLKITKSMNGGIRIRIYEVSSSLRRKIKN